MREVADSNLEDMHIQNFIKWAMRPMIGRIQDVDEALQRFASIGMWYHSRV